MKNIFDTGSKACQLLLWPTNPKERKGEFEIALYLDKNKPLNVGDEIKGGGNKDEVSVYTIKTITENRPGTVKNMNYIRGTATWKMRPIGH
ncbi:hypothetical protein [Christiangramia sp.]|uniref:hypothetical protein n=1 Tax=Christiangramia sp. TaxID=1931228 RepID=UPI002639319D|nr:hypothetical protein [Christiangramia sp.]